MTKFSCLGWLRTLVLLSLLCGAGCAGLRENSGNGVEPTVFRGRWWNYYERGQAKLFNEALEEAELDLRKALLGRPHDQYWPRTYGLHFVPEYFPHRELGIVYYLQGRPEKAIKELELSLEQQFSSRAAFYLGESRREVVVNGNLDKDSPRITFLNDAGFDTTATSTILTGVVVDDTFVSSVSVNGEPLYVELANPEVSFSHEVQLSGGDNTFRIDVWDVAGKHTERTITLETDFAGPAVSFDTPISVPGILHGVAYDTAGISEMLVSGKNAHLSESENGRYDFSIELKVGDSTHFICKDKNGNATEGTVTPNTVALVPPGTAVVPALNSMMQLPLSTGVTGFFISGQLAALTIAQNSSGKATVEFTDMQNGDIFYSDSIVFTVDIDPYEETIDSAVLLHEGEPADTTIMFIPDGRQIISFKVPNISIGENNFEFQVTTSSGQTSTATIQIMREESVFESAKYKSSLAILGADWHGESSITTSATEYVIRALLSGIQSTERFTCLNRSETIMQNILMEREIAQVLNQESYRRTMEPIINADLFLAGSVTADSRAYTLRGALINAQSSEEYLTADVTGRVQDREDIERLASYLADRLVQAYPRLQGKVTRVLNDSAFVMDLGSAHHLNLRMDCVILRDEIGWPEEVGLARIEDLMTNASKAVVINLDNEGSSEIREGDTVVTK